VTQDIYSSGPVGHTLQRLCKLSAAVGGIGLVGAALLTLASVAGRALFRTPILGDVELVQLSCAVALSAFMPYTQWLGGNIIVDFFTTGLSKPAQSRLDALGALLLGIAMLLLGWRTVVGSTIAYGNHETSMLMSIPLWITYALMAPFLLLTGVVAVYKAWRLWTHAGRGASGARGHE
jgi:TRAP-type C4-dicarboxylate transport system permease small subunit